MTRFGKAARALDRAGVKLRQVVGGNMDRGPALTPAEARVLVMLDEGHEDIDEIAWDAGGGDRRAGMAAIKALATRKLIRSGVDRMGVWIRETPKGRALLGAAEAVLTAAAAGGSVRNPRRRAGRAKKRKTP